MKQLQPVRLTWIWRGNVRGPSLQLRYFVSAIWVAVHKPQIHIMSEYSRMRTLQAQTTRN